MRYGDIDPDFPVAGQDNESEGFRVNFAAIQDSLEYTNDQLNTLVDVTLKTGINNDVNFGTLENARLLNQYEATFVSGSAVTGSQTISYLSGSYYKLVLGNTNPITLTIDDFPVTASGEDGRFAKIRVELTSQNNVARTVVFAPGGTNPIRYDGQFPSTVVVSSATEPVIIEFWSANGGQTIYAKYLGVFSETARTSTFENVVANGNVTLGNDAISDVTTFKSVIQYPVVLSNQINDITKSAGMMLYDAQANNFYACKATGDSIAAYNIITGTRYVIVTVGDTDFTAIGASSNSIGVSFTATGVGVNQVGAGTVKQLAWVVVST